jgi:AcrR family transcriptional regulator
MSRLDTKQRILDAAEQLFARDGFHRTSLRAITSKAKVNLAAVNYHFGSKKALLEAVFERRLLPLNRTRKERLEEVLQNARKRGVRPEVRDIMRAFIEPTFRFRESEPGAQDFIKLIGRSIVTPDSTAKTVLLRFMKPILKTLSEALTEALPELPKDVLLWRLYFSIGALAHTMHLDKRFQFEPLNLKAETDVKSLTNMLITFVTAGMEAS